MTCGIPWFYPVAPPVDLKFAVLLDLTDSSNSDLYLTLFTFFIVEVPSSSLMRSSFSLFTSLSSSSSMASQLFDESSLSISYASSWSACSIKRGALTSIIVVYTLLFYSCIVSLWLMPRIPVFCLMTLSAKLRKKSSFLWVFLTPLSYFLLIPIWAPFLIGYIY